MVLHLESVVASFNDKKHLNFEKSRTVNKVGYPRIIFCNTQKHTQTHLHTKSILEVWILHIHKTKQEIIIIFVEHKMHKKSVYEGSKKNCGKFVAKF